MTEIDLTEKELFTIIHLASESVENFKNAKDYDFLYATVNKALGLSMDLI
jgi:hypothetical protein